MFQQGSTYLSSGRASWSSNSHTVPSPVQSIGFPDLRHRGWAPITGSLVARPRRPQKQPRPHQPSAPGHESPSASPADVSLSGTAQRVVFPADAPHFSVPAASGRDSGVAPPWAPRAVLLGCCCTGFAWTPASVSLEHVPGSGAGALLWASRARTCCSPTCAVAGTPTSRAPGSSSFLQWVCGAFLAVRSVFPRRWRWRMMASCFVWWAVTEVSVNLLSRPLFLTQGPFPRAVPSL